MKICNNIYSFHSISWFKRISNESKHPGRLIVTRYCQLRPISTTGNRGREMAESPVCRCPALAACSALIPHIRCRVRQEGRRARAPDGELLRGWLPPSFNWFITMLAMVVTPWVFHCPQPGSAPAGFSEVGKLYSPSLAGCSARTVS